MFTSRVVGETEGSMFVKQNCSRFMISTGQCQRSGCTEHCLLCQALELQRRAGLGADRWLQQATGSRRNTYVRRPADAGRPGEEVPGAGWACSTQPEASISEIWN